MATYIQNVQDKITSVRPPETDWQFEAQLLSTRQAKYDAGHKKLSDMYGKILNSGLTRENNIEARDEFFKLIDSDLRKVAGMDLSLESNVTQAQNVFNQVYDNDFLVKDMVWTKNFQSEMKRADGFKNCIDKEACGGQYWDDGVKYMNYKREEFKNSSNEESMVAQNVRYIPYNNMMVDAIKMANEAGLTVTRDEVTGKYITRTVNGTNLVSPLTRMFDELYRKNPQFQDQYNLLAYNERKDWTYGAVQRGEFETVEEAATGYVELKANEIISASEKIMDGLDMDVSSLKSKIKALENDFKKGVYKPDNQKKLDELAGYQKVLGYTETAKQHTDMIRSAQKNMHNLSSMEAIASVLDQSRSLQLYNTDLISAGETLAHQNMETTMTADKFALEDQRYRHNVSIEAMRIKAAKEAAELKALNDKKNLPFNMDASISRNAFADKKAALVEFSVMGKAVKAFSESFPDEFPDLHKKIKDMDEKALRKHLRDNPSLSKHKAYPLLQEALNVQGKIKREINDAAYKAIEKGNDPADFEGDINWDVMDKHEHANLKRELGNYYNSFDPPLGVQGFDQGFGSLVYSYGSNGRKYIYKDNVWYRSAAGANVSSMSDFTEIKNQESIDELLIGAIPWNK